MCYVMAWVHNTQSDQETGGAVKYRQIKGGLDESLATEREIPATLEALALEASLVLGRAVNPQDVTVSAYGYDHRTLWDTHIVEVKGIGPIGFTDGPVPNA